MSTMLGCTSLTSSARCRQPAAAPASLGMAGSGLKPSDSAFGGSWLAVSPASAEVAGWNS
jgi:hypothetical protein